MARKLNRQLLLMRHGKSDWSSAAEDFDRPLKKRGKRAAQLMGVWLRQQNRVPDYIVSSPAERAANTAAKLSKALGLTAKHVHHDRRLYEADLNDLVTVLAQCPANAERVLLIGHNPGLEELLLHLHKGTVPCSEDAKLLPTATLAIVAMPDDWRHLNQACAEVVSIMRPRSLPDKFPFNGLTGTEQRDRPAYYYSQSAALPYRVDKGELQFLLISSSGNNHWGIPKGIIEPGCSASASAEIEAWEEAGIEGVISDEMLGYYSYEKWGGNCTVQVFPMVVTHMVDDAAWEESHRIRQWLPLDKAKALINQKAQQAMLVELAGKITGTTV